MSFRCPDGHDSSSDEYCDVCGLRIASPATNQATIEPDGLEEVDTSPAARSEQCPRCQTPRWGDSRFCEVCRFDFLAPPASWEAVAAPDRSQFDRLGAAHLTFPHECGPRSFALSGEQVRIGRSRGRPDETAPEIDLAGEPEDPGISRLHAVLERQADGSYAVRDLGSTNGTTLNDDPRPISTDNPVPLAAGDRIRLGAWTTIVVRRAADGFQNS